MEDGKEKIKRTQIPGHDGQTARRSLVTLPARVQGILEACHTTQARRAARVWADSSWEWKEWSRPARCAGMRLSAFHFLLFFPTKRECSGWAAHSAAKPVGDGQMVGGGAIRWEHGIRSTMHRGEAVGFQI